MMPVATLADVVSCMDELEERFHEHMIKRGVHVEMTTAEVEELRKRVNRPAPPALP